MAIEIVDLPIENCVFSIVFFCMLPEGNQLTVNHSQPFTNASNPAPRPGCSGFQVAMNQSESVSYLLDQVYKLGAVGGGSPPDHQNCGKVQHPGNRIMVLVGGLEHGFYDFPYIGKNHPNLTFIFFRGVETTNQLW